MNGRNQLGERDDDMSVCLAVRKAFTVIDYGGIKKRYSGRDSFIKISFGLLFSHWNGLLHPMERYQLLSLMTPC